MITRTADASPQRAAFLDRDGTVIIDRCYLDDPKDVVLCPKAADAIAGLRRMGFLAIVVTNQSGIARGMFGHRAVEAIHHRLNELLLAEHPGARIDAYYYCPHGPGEDGQPKCGCRKPMPGMLRQAAVEHQLDLSRSVAFGDSDRDMAAAEASGCGLAWHIGPGGSPTLEHAAGAHLAAMALGRTT